MTRKYLIDGVAQADSSVLIKGRAEGLDTAADGSSATATAIIRDPTGVQSFTPWMEFAVEEDACSRARGWTGYLVNETISRGGYAIGVATGSPREWSFELFDLNSLLHRQVLRNLAVNKRPRESGSARMAWLLASEALSGIVFDNGKVQANPWMFDEADYRGKYADDVLADISVSSIDTELGELSFVYWDETAAAGHERSLFYHGPTATTSTSTISLSNVDADVNNTTCFWVHPDPTLERQGEDIYCGVYFTTRNGSIYRHSATTHAAFFAGKPHRDGTFSTDRISLGATAETHAARWLSNHSGTIDTLKLTARLTPAAVNLLDAGMRVSVRLPHLPGFATATYLRVRRRTLPIEEGKRLWYDVPLELSLKGIPFAGGGNPGGFPFPSSCAAGDSTTDDLAYTYGTASVSNPYGISISYGNVPANLIDHNYTSLVGAGSSGAPAVGVPFYVQWNIDLGTAKNVATAIVAVDTADTAIGGGAGHEPAQGIEVWASDNGSTYHRVTLASAWAGPDTTTAPGSNIYTVDIPSVDRSHRYWAMRVLDTFYGGFWGGFTVQDFRLIACLGGGPTAPPPGQWVGISPPEIVTMSGANGTTAWPFADNSLVVLQDSFDQSTHIASYDGAAGTFTLDYTPGVGSTITVRYQGR